MSLSLQLLPNTTSRTSYFKRCTPKIRFVRSRLSLVITSACFSVPRLILKIRCTDECFSVDFSCKQTFPLRSEMWKYSDPRPLNSNLDKEHEREKVMDYCAHMFLLNYFETLLQRILNLRQYFNCRKCFSQSKLI